MKTTLTTLLLSALLLVRYVDDSVLLTLAETQFTHQSNLPNRVKLPEKEGMYAENQFSVTKNINIELCKEVI
jgi:hypothetical protein